MRDNVQLHVIRREAQIMAGLSEEPGVSAYSRERLNLRINQIERRMAEKDSWPVRHYEITGVVAGDAQYTNFPDGVTPTNLRSAHVLFGDQWLPMTMGISPADRSVYNTAMRSTPATKWDVNVARPGQFEIWPIGASAQTILFRGQRTIGGMAEDNDTCALDADVIVMRLAAEILARNKSDDAAFMLSEAEAHSVNVLKGMMSTAESPNLAQRRGASVRPYIDFIPPRGAI